MLWMAVLGIGMLVAPVISSAAPDDPWDTRFYANGTEPQAIINAVAVSGGNVYVGGRFSSIFGVNAINIARWNGSTWSALGIGIGGSFAEVRSLAVSGGDLYVGGYFSTAGGISANHIAKWNGTTWSSLGTGMNSTVHGLAVSGSTVYAGGEFTTAGGSTANRIAQWNGASWSSLGTGMSSTVRALALSGSILYAGGEFTTAGGATANRIAQWDGASWSSLGTGMNERVLALTVNGTDLYAGGAFTSAGGVGANRVALWNGTTWAPLGSGTSNWVYGLAIAGGDLYAAGPFSTAGGNTVRNIARWNGATWSSLAGGGPELMNPGGALAGSGSDLYVGGQFVGAGGTAATSLARWDGSTWSLATTTPGFGAASSGIYPGVRALAYSGSGDLYATGVFEFAGATPAISIAKFDGTGWSALGAGLEGPGFANYFHGFGQALAFYGGDLYVGGSFATAGGVTVRSIARWNGSSFSALGSGINSTIGGQYVVNALIDYNGYLYVGGSFSEAGGLPVSNIARWNGATWASVGSGVNGSVNAFTILGSDLYVGGQFTTAGGGAANYVARWDGSNWSAVGSGPGGAPLALAAVGSDLYAGGSFPSGTAIRKWDGSTWSTPGGGICFGCGLGGQAVRGLASVGNDLYVSGGFDFVGSGGSAVSASGIAKWNGVSWSALGSGLPWSCVGSSCPFYSSAGPVVVAGTDVFVGGRFTSAGGKPASFVAIWHNCGNGVVDPNEQCDDGNTTSGDCCSSTCQYEAGGGACADDGNPCTNDQCNGSGGCAHPPNTAPCDDGIFCNGVDVCSGGTCTHPGDPCPGADGDGNCSESCDEAADTCTAPDPNGSACNDGLFCNGADQCSAGACTVHGGDPCPGPDGDANCAESCDEAADACTAADPNGSACNDGLFCTGADTCSGGACSGHTGDPCVGGVECNNVCNEGLDTCALAAGTPCTADGNPCTDDQCNGAGSCTHPNNTAPCDDGLFCNGADVCAGGTCTHAGNPCAGGPECADTCNEGADDCFEAAGTPCTADANPCTLDQCDGTGACAHPNVTDGTVCSDGDACTTGETCTGGVCGGGSTTVCALCETCDTLGGCVEAPRPSGCKQPTQALKASILLQDRTPDDLDQVKWKWASGQATSFGELGDPLATHDYALCVYDAASTLLLRMTAPAGGTCGTNPCWKQLGSALAPKGYKYRDLDGLPHDLDSMTLKSGLDGKAKVSLKGKGLNVPMPALGSLALPLTTQLQSGNGQCYEMTTTTPSANTTTLFKAKGD
jgi:hypothetical protein